MKRARRPSSLNRRKKQLSKSPSSSGASFSDRAGLACVPKEAWGSITPESFTKEAIQRLADSGLELTKSYKSKVDNGPKVRPSYVGRRGMQTARSSSPPPPLTPSLPFPLVGRR